MAVGTIESLPNKLTGHFQLLKNEENKVGHGYSSESWESPLEQNNRDPVAVNSTVDLREILHMSCGNGETSYARNSKRQRSVFRAVSRLFADLIFESPHVQQQETAVMRIADLGCATGINTISQVDFVIKGIKAVCATRCLPSPEFRVFFNDLPSNDFNYLFRLLQEHKAEDEYFAAAVPGSFYNLLFPPASIHVCFSIMALHWLSQVPAAVEQEDSPAYNRGKVWINGSRADVAKAYAQQSRRDLAEFFSFRAQEMVSGGVMFICAMGRPNSEPPEHQVAPEGEYCGPDFEAAWEDLISQGIVKPEARDGFNLPWYFPNAEEMREAIEGCSAFEIRRLEVRSGVGCMSDEEFQDWVSDGRSFGERKSNMVRSFAGSLVEQKIGSDNADALFHRLGRRSTEFLKKKIIRPSRFVTCIVAALIRK